MQQENWILKRINDSLIKNGHLTESDLLLLRTQLMYCDEYRELLEIFSSNSSVESYNFIKNNNCYLELLEFFSNRQSVKDYNFMMREVKIINDAERELKNHEWCHHILVQNSDNNYQCIRCGVIADEKFHCHNYVLLNNCEYTEGRKLYDEAIRGLEANTAVTSIITKMLDIKSSRVVKTKRQLCKKV